MAPTLPSPTTFFDGIAVWSAPFFTDMLPWAYLAIGIPLALGLVLYVFTFATMIYRFLTHNTQFIGTRAFSTIPSFLQQPVSSFDHYLHRKSMDRDHPGWDQ